ncbi:probable 1-acyl-sn-glycerol-3-phosphate acyltransferase 5 isoform X1 [Carica papaya]|uniref:probable 1-acyl-sn-glycerol-3-phosphate acyltransferase 5 isoform X1 n=1 Tax=Carica papaya TaxID=3649 RepID=UPI000B8D1983|nr:probable 1-acyl-sn-glycerol-3-phosphate acyltransferase 5 isoform X1 [Carica papaya]XP_021896674.1 probable 1-acyl-sn-glycerol-3-phosphate acyltransferase 5 isoform X1 [Carica papaya]XP_021896675.1 probable 1-acyl-sn-glycerol-3-phosphate acyltransferase 5 isoform X1 [Carica papaya]
MEVKGVLSSNEGMRHRPLTPLRVCRGLICLLVLLSTAFVMLVFCGFPGAVILRLFSIHCSRKTTSFFFSAWLALWPFLFEKINNTKVVFSGENVPARERVLLIANHRTEVDWMYFWDLALRKECLGYIKYVLKSSLMKLPIFGWGFYILEFISVERKWEFDEPNLRQMLSTFKDPRDPLWLALFPEGTDFTNQKCIRSKKYAAERGLPILNNVLLPKTKGFHACLEELRGSLDAVYDVTIGYKNRCPSLLDNVFGVDPSEVHIHIERIKPGDIPTVEEEVAEWLMGRFQVKDQLLGNFYSEGHFPQEGTEDDLSTMKCIVNFLSVIILTSTCTYFTFSTSVWFKIYVSLACTYLASATHFNIRPVPLIRYVKAMFNRRFTKC